MPSNRCSFSLLICFLAPFVCAVDAQEPRQLPLLTDESKVKIDVFLLLFLENLEAQEQFPGSLSDTYAGLLPTVTRQSEMSLELHESGFLAAGLQPQELRPAFEGEPGAAPGNYGGTVSLLDPVPVPSIEALGNLNLGTLASANVDMAMRDLVVTVLPTQPLPTDESGLFDADGVDLGLRANADVRGQIILEANNAVDYAVNFLLLRLLGQELDEITDVSGDPSRNQITIGIASRLTVDEEMVDNEPIPFKGHLSRNRENVNLKIPLDIAITDEVIEEVLDVEFRITGEFTFDVQSTDIDGNQFVEAGDIDLLSRMVLQATNNTLFDLDLDGVVNAKDRDAWVSLFGTAMGDADLDRDIDFSDFLVLSANFGKAGGWALGDFDGSTAVDFSDFLLLSANFGTSAGASITTPEPSSQCCLLYGLVTAMMLSNISRQERRRS